MSGNIEEIKVKARNRVSAEVKGTARVEVRLRKCKSLPSVWLVSGGSFKGGGTCGEVVVVKKGFGQRPKILRKTWDKVKGIIHSPIGGGTSGGGGERDGGSGRRGVSSCSAPSTPLKGEGKFFGEEGVEDEKERIARNYKLLQKRLSQEFRQSSLKGKGAFGGEFSDDFKRKLFEWESHPSRRKGKERSKENVAVGGGGSSGGGGMSSRHLKELAWLDKQLDKIEAEKRRLEEELKKQVEREVRVQKMKEAIRLSVSDRVYNIRTENGVKFRVEPFTSEYAMKVYEWEEKRGIGVEMSALGYFDPKYRDDEEETRGDGSKSSESVVVEVKEEEVVGPLDLINERLKKIEGEERDGLAERGALLLAECVALGEEAAAGGRGIEASQDGRVSSTASSCCCSAEYDESFATKNNSGASNTDSDLYDKRCTIARRRSSDCVSTPDRVSPGLSAFTSEEDEVREEEGAGGKDVDKGKDLLVAPLCVKQIVISSADDDEVVGVGGSNVFVQTKRTIFSPVVDEVDGGGGDECCGDNASLCSARVVGVVPKTGASGYKPQPKTQLHRVFPGNLPVYCSPMAARRAFGGQGTEQGGRFGVGRKLPPRTNVNVPRKYTIGGGIPPALGRNCIIARSNSFQFREKVQGDGGCVGGSGAGGSGGIDDHVVGFGVSKSKSTGSIKRSINSVKSFLGFGGKENVQVQQQQQRVGGGSGDVSAEAQGAGERRGSRSGRWRIGALWGNKGKEGGE